MGKNSQSRNSNPNALANPTALEPFDSEDKNLVYVVIETPKGSRNKYSFKPELGVYLLKRVLPQGMSFPYDFGFVPCTEAEDGDPLDVLVLMDEPAFTGCLLKCRLIGVIEAEQKDKEGKYRNDRVLAIEQSNHTFADVTQISDLGQQFLQELEQFFVNYHRLLGGEYRIISRKGPGGARKIVEQSIR